MLEVESIHTFYGMSHILFDVSLKIKQGQVVCLLGRNGAGKTTTLRSIMGLVPPVRGRVRLHDEDVTGVAPYRLARKGIGYVPDDRRIFADLTVGENLAIAARQGPGTEAWDKDKVYELFPPLRPMDGRRAHRLLPRTRDRGIRARRDREARQAASEPGSLRKHLRRGVRGLLRRHPAVRTEGRSSSVPHRGNAGGRRVRDDLPPERRLGGRTGGVARDRPAGVLRDARLRS